MRRIIIPIIFLAMGCSKDEPTPEVKLVPKELYERHIDKFYVEASTRGKSPARITPEVRYTSNSDFENTCVGSADTKKGSTSYKDGDKYIIEISERLSFNQNDSFTETIIYREFAHLTLSKPYSEMCVIPSAGLVTRDLMCQCDHSIPNGEAELKRSLDYLFQ